MGSIPVIKKSRKKVRSSRKLIALLLLFFISILVLLFFNSSLSRIQTIEIHGAVMTQDTAVVQASGLQLQDSFFSINQNEVIERVKQLNWVESANIVKHFPGKIVLEINEHEMVAYELLENNERMAVLSDGSTLPLSDQMPAADITVLTGWHRADELKAELARTLAQIPDELTQFISEIKPIPSAAYPDKIQIYTRSSFEVVTTVEYLPHKLSYLPSMIRDLLARDIVDGTLTLLEADTHSPFEKDSSKLLE